MEPVPAMEQTTRKSPSFESGRLQLRGEESNEDALMVQEGTSDPMLDRDRLPATLRLGSSRSGSKKKGDISIASQSKLASKRKVTRTVRRVSRSPLLGLAQKKPPVVGPSTTRRKTGSEKDHNLPCNKAGTSKQRKKSERPTTVFILGSTRGGVDFLPHQNSLP